MTEVIDVKTNGLLFFTVLVDGNELNSSYNVKQIYITKEINKISLCKFIIHENDSGEENFKISNSNDIIPGKKIEIKLGYNNEIQTIFKGIITAHGLKLSKNNSVISVECRDEAIKLTAGRKSNVFEKKKDSEIITEIIKSYNFTKEVEETKVQHNEIVQHYCSDWDFIMMRAEICGLIVMTDNGKLVVKRPMLSVPPAFEVTYGINMINFSADIDSKSQYQSITALSWDIANQKIIKSYSKSTNELHVGSQTTTTLSEVVGGKEFILQSPVNMPNDALETWANAKYLKSSLSKLKGKVEFAGNSKVEPGSLLKLSGLSDHFNGIAFVSGVEHTIELGEWKTTAHLGVKFEWYTEGIAMIDPPSASGLVAPFKGLAIGIVRQLNMDKEGQYRIKISLPTLQKDNLTVWARLANFYATKDAGVFFYPEINDEVVVGFLNEDPQHPIIMGVLYSSKNKPVYTPDNENRIKAISTKSNLTISFDDTDKIIEITTPDKNSIKISDKDALIRVSDKNNNSLTLSKEGVTITTEKDFILKAKGKIVIESTSDMQFTSKSVLKTEAKNIDIQGKSKFSVKAATVEVNGSGQTTIKGGMVMIN